MSFIYSKDNFERCPMIHSWIILVPLDWLMARHTSGAVHSIAYYRAYVWSIGDDLRPFSLFCCGQVLSLTQYSHLVTQPRTPSLLIYFELFQNHVKVCVLWKYHRASWSISIDLDAQYVSSFYPGLPLKNSFQTTLYAFQKFYIISDQQYVIHIYLSEML